MRLNFLVLALLMTACRLPASEYVDVSHEERFQDLLGTSRITKSELLMLGIDSYPSKKRTKYFLLMPPPGLDGPEVLSRSSLPTGTVVKIVGAESCTNCGSRSERFLLRIESLDASEPVYLKSDFLGELSVDNGGGTD